MGSTPKRDVMRGIFTHLDYFLKMVLGEGWMMSAEYPHDWITKELGDFAKAAGGSRFPPVAQGKHEGDYPFY